LQLRFAWCHQVYGTSVIVTVAVWPGYGRLLIWALTMQGFSSPGIFVGEFALTGLWAAAAFLAWSTTAEGLCTLEVLRSPVTLHLVLGSTTRRVDCSTTKDRSCAYDVWSMPKLKFSDAVAKFKILQVAKFDEAWWWWNTLACTVILCSKAEWHRGIVSTTWKSLQIPEALNQNLDQAAYYTRNQWAAVSDLDKTRQSAVNNLYMEAIMAALRRGTVTNITVPVTSVWSRLPAAVMLVLVASLVEVVLQLIVTKP
jgi:hypothetical protein